MNTKYNELEEVYEVDLKNTSGAELLAIETPNKYVTYAGLERAVRNVLSKAKDYDKGLAGGYNGTFPLTAATKGNIYLLPATKKYYICIKDYSGSQLSAPNSNFEELSVYANRSKLDNLGTQDDIVSGSNYSYTIYNLGVFKLYVGYVVIPNGTNNVLVQTSKFTKCTVVGTDSSNGVVATFANSTKNGFYIYSTINTKAVSFIAVIR